MLGISVSGMKSRVRRGRQQLRRALEDCCLIALDARSVRFAGLGLACEERIARSSDVRSLLGRRSPLA